MLVKFNLKDVARLDQLNREGFIALVEGENALLWSAAAGCLRELVGDSRKLDDLSRYLLKTSKLLSSLLLEGE